MNLDDYPPWDLCGQRVRQAPELPRDRSALSSRCSMCAFEPMNDRQCQKALIASGHACHGHTAYIFVPEEKFEDYVVEFVRRRISE